MINAKICSTRLRVTRHETDIDSQSHIEIAREIISLFKNDDYVEYVSVDFMDEREGHEYDEPVLSLNFDYEEAEEVEKVSARILNAIQRVEKELSK